jgi:hypothetical protein
MIHHHPARPSRAATLAALLLATRLAAQCTDPAMPPGGFPITEILGRQYTFADGAITMADIRYPTTAPGSCGWPEIWVMHFMTGDRSAMSWNGRELAARGYFTVVYDVRGHGDSRLLNPRSVGMKFVGDTERLDLCEMVQLVEAQFPALADRQRRGITGTSLGAIHSWAAAAWSGKPMPANARGITRFPDFRAACPMIWSPGETADMIPGDKAFAPDFIRIFFFYGGVYQTIGIEPVFEAAAQGHILNENFAAAAAMFRNDPFRQDLAQLATSTTAVCPLVSFQDSWVTGDQSILALQSMPATTSKRILLGPPGHGDPNNDRQQFHQFDLQHRWFARHLKGENNRVDQEPVWGSVVFPESQARLGDTRSLLWNRLSDTWPPPSSPQRWYLRQGSALTPAPPTGVEPAEVVRHQPPAGLTITGWIVLTQVGAHATMATMPFSTIPYDTAPLSADLELAGAPRVRLEVTPDTGDYQVHCALLAVDAAGVEVFLTQGFALMRGGPAVPVALDIDLHHTHARLSAGQRLRLRVENLTLRRTAAPPPFDLSLRTAPYFNVANVAVEHSAARPSWLEVPALPVVAPTLTAVTPVVYVAAPVDVEYELEAPAALAGSIYVLLFSHSGVAPGFVVSPGPAGHVRLNFDLVTQSLLGAFNTPLLPAGVGILGPQGIASPRPRLRLTQVPGVLPGLRGQQVDALALVFTASDILASSPTYHVYQ